MLLSEEVTSYQSTPSINQLHRGINDASQIVYLSLKYFLF